VVTPAQRKEIAHYLETGETEQFADAWPGNVVDREIRQDQALRDALIAEVKRRTRRRRLRTPEVDPIVLTRERVEPMVRGLFPKVEQTAVLSLLETSVVFVTPGSIEHVLREGSSWLSTTWSIANLYLRSLGAPLLGPDAPNVVGLSADLRCFVTVEYLEHRASTDRSFEDFVVHECAHVLHDAKPYRIGLPERRTRERLVDLEFRKRETFAYACEAYRMLVEHGRRPRDRGALLDELVEQGVPGDETVDRAELVDILREAAKARNGWKQILARCAEQRPRRRRSQGAAALIA
jgi:hypothetical protein